MSEKASRPAIGILWRSLAALLGVAMIGLGAFAFISEGEGALAGVAIGAGAILVGLSVFGAPLIEGVLQRGGEVEWGGAKAKFPVPPDEASAEADEQEAPPSAEVVSPPQPPEPEPPAQESERPLVMEAIDAIHDGNLQKFDELWTKVIEEAPDENARLGSKAFRLYVLYTRGGQTSALEELLSLKGQHPQSLSPVRNLALCYEEARNYPEAAKLYQETRNIENLSNDERLKALDWEVGALIKAERYRDAESAVKEVSSIADTALERARIHKLLGQVCRASGQVDEADWHYEQYLELNPADTEARFGLAHSYAERDLNHLALYHYEILVDAYDDSGAMNNLALIHEALEMPISAASLFKRSAQKGDTIAFGNIARRLAEQGFDSEAEEWIARARGHENVHEYVDNVANQLSSNKKSESERVEEVTKAASMERNFFFKRLESQRSGIKSDPTGVSGEWNIDNTDIVMRVTPSDSEITAHFKEDVWDWELKGEISGRLFTFAWTCDKSWENTSGDGILIFNETGTQFDGILRHTPEKGKIKAISGTKSGT